MYLVQNLNKKIFNFLEFLINRGSIFITVGLVFNCKKYNNNNNNKNNNYSVNKK
jgi:hypothetical protein